MKTETEIRDRVRGLLVQELDRRVAEAQKRLPRRCVNNHRHPLDTRKEAEGETNENFNRITAGRSLPVSQTIGLCMLNADDPENWGGTICEDPIDAATCPMFTPKQSKEEMLVEFQEQLRTEGWLEENLPAAANLLWALEEVQTAVLPWWKALWYRWVLKINIEPVVKTQSALLLEGPDEDATASP